MIDFALPNESVGARGSLSNGSVKYKQQIQGASLQRSPGSTGHRHAWACLPAHAQGTGLWAFWTGGWLACRPYRKPMKWLAELPSMCPGVRSRFQCSYRMWFVSLQWFWLPLHHIAKACIKGGLLVHALSILHQAKFAILRRLPEGQI